MEKICLQCGDIGWDRQLVYCIKCKESALHRYCMDVMPEKDEFVQWVCEECLEAESPSDSSSPQKSMNREQKVLESDAKISTKKMKKNQTGDESLAIGKTNFLYSFTCFGGLRQLYESNIPAEPHIRSIWTGSFDLWSGNNSAKKRINGFSAYLSSKSCEKVWQEAAFLQPVMQCEMLSRFRVWPKSFQGRGPTDGNVAVYFFPSLMKYERVYDYLVSKMTDGDLAMRAFVHNAELLIFTSAELPLRFWRFQGKEYLWGVFRQRIEAAPLVSG